MDCASSPTSGETTEKCNLSHSDARTTPCGGAVLGKCGSGSCCVRPLSGAATKLDLHGQAVHHYVDLFLVLLGGVGHLVFPAISRGEGGLHCPWSAVLV